MKTIDPEGVEVPKIGVCSLCGMEGPLTYHHIIPKRLNVNGVHTCRVCWNVPIRMEKGQQIWGLKFRNIPCVTTHLMLPLCDLCHTIIHPENFSYTKSQMMAAMKTGKEYVPEKCKRCKHQSACLKTDHACDHFDAIEVEISDLTTRLEKW